MYDKPSLVVLAAGMGSRFGGLKQLTPVGRNGETLLDYSVYDARKAGFERVVFIIKKAIEADFREKIGRNIERHMQVDYVFQELNALPNGYRPPEGRSKPWGTGHAAWCATTQTDISSFMVINSDDYYGNGCFKTLYSFLSAKPEKSEKIKLAMSGYRLGNTLSENGSVSRGICEVSADNTLLSLTERKKIERRAGGAAYADPSNDKWVPLDENCFVSMNCFAFPADAKPFFTLFLKDFLDRNSGELTAEFHLPDVPGFLIKNSIGEVCVLPTEDKWYGVTYAADLPSVSQAIARLADEGCYPQRLWAGE